MESNGAGSTGCRIEQTTDDNFDWRRGRAKTPSGAIHDRRINGIKYPVTGPSSAREGEYYLFTEASGRRRGDIARYADSGIPLRSLCSIHISH